MRPVFGSVVGAILIASVAGVVAAKRQVIDSHWRDRDVRIDGDNGDWPGPLVPVEENHPVLTAAVNDGQSLYLVLTTSDATVRRQILRQGLIVWFDPSGGEKKHLGLKYPVGIIPEDATSNGGYRRGGGGYRRPHGDSGSGDTTQSSTSSDLDVTDRVEVYGSQKDDVHSFVTAMAPGIEVKVGQVDGYLVYELKVPLAKTADAPYAIEAKPGALIGFGVETPKMQQPSHEAGRGGGGLGGFGGGGGMGGRGGRGGHGGGGGGGGRGGGDRGQAEQTKPLKTWAAIQLAKVVSSTTSSQ